MPTINIQLSIRAPATRIFDLGRSVDAHLATTDKTDERAVAGVTSGLLNLGDHVTFSARHFGWRWKLTSRMTVFDRPRHFRDSMVDGPFARFDHDHYFDERDGATLVTEVFDFTSPLGVLGRIADVLFVEKHMRCFLECRLQRLKQLAESDGWREYLSTSRCETANGTLQ